MQQGSLKVSQHFSPTLRQQQPSYTLYKTKGPYNPKSHLYNLQSLYQPFELLVEILLLFSPFISLLSYKITKSWNLLINPLLALAIHSKRRGKL